MFGELVCGPPGSGKTTYCEGKRQFLSVYDPTRPVVLLNLDPANEDVFPYPCDVDVRELVSHARVMEEEGLGPNGCYVFCATVMERNMDWICRKIEEAVERRLHDIASTVTSHAASGGLSSTRAPYLVVDCPGQVEFYVGSSVMHTLFRMLAKQLSCSLCTVHLVDAAVSTRDVATYVSSCLLSITTMIDHELPHVNVMSKWDMLSVEEAEEGETFLRASHFMAEDFDRLWKQQLRRRRREHRRAQMYPTASTAKSCVDPKRSERDDAEVEAIDLQRDGGRLYHYSKTVMDVVDGYGLVGFQPLDVQSQDMMLRLTQQIDEALGNFV
ncbi:cytoplasmic protein [Trypanosoma rangeli]|uniref:GPN-loop GTPase 2 n=1 Tax=Trypanosoma rangeli TaxID=5698 RepID=A0A422NVI7_TRYRA|nr:cytoplasmic protein [Trypanosoma rangeli]RNF09467.1 cytoplasmic protein [Trypanosoma rangeli]|eukprot:RNF09467.1 cytoplasmic protein [Trypanosoma rangeli]